MKLSIPAFGLGFSLFFLLSGSRPMLAQVIGPSGCSVPLSLGDPLSGPTAAPETLEVAVRWGKLSTNAQAVLDRNSHRSVIVLDNSKYVTNELWKVEISLASDLFDRVPASDSLALYVISDHNEILDFSSPRSVQLKRVRELLAARPPNKIGSRHIYDALLGAADLLGTPRFADTILYFGGGIDHDSLTSHEALARVLLAHGVRLFGVLFKGLSHAKEALRRDMTALSVLDLAEQTGGLMEYESAENPWHEFKFSPEELDSAWKRVTRAYWRATTAYRMDLSVLPPPNKPSELRISLPAPGSTKAGETDLLYPHQKWVCTAQS